MTQFADFYFPQLAGTESYDRIFTPEKLSRGNSATSAVGFSPSFDVCGGSWNSGMESTVASLEEAVLDSKAKCAALANKLSSSETSGESLVNVKQLNETLESMQVLLNKLRTQL